MKNLFLELKEYLYYILLKVLELLLLIPLIIFMDILHFKNPIINIKKCFKNDKEDEETRGGCFGYGRHEIIYPWTFPINILRNEKNERLKIIREYTNKEKLNREEFYHILYASKSLGFIFCYFGYSRRIKIETANNYISQKYTLNLSYIIKNMVISFHEKKIGEKDLLNFITATYKYTNKSQTKKLKLTECLIDSVFDLSKEEDLLLNKIEKIILQNKSSTKEINYYLNKVFDYFFRYSVEIEEEVSRIKFINKLKTHTNNHIIYLEDKLNKEIQYEYDKSNLKNERNKNTEKTIKNIILMLYESKIPLKEGLSKIPNDTILNELKTKISKELLYYELDDKLDNKKKNKVVKI